MTGEQLAKILRGRAAEHYHVANLAVNGKEDFDLLGDELQGRVFMIQASVANALQGIALEVAKLP